MRPLQCAAAFAIVLFGFTAPASAVTVLSGSGTIDSTDSFQNGRITRNGIASTWAAPKSFPLLAATGPFAYDEVHVAFAPNLTQTIFYEITWTNLDTASPFSVAYLGNFNPADISQNYLGDGGASGPTPITYQVVVPAGDVLDLVFSSTVVGSPNPSQRYEFTVSAFTDANHGDFGTVPLPAALPLFATGLGALGLLAWRRNRNATA